MSEQTPNSNRKPFVEELEVAGNQLVERVRDLVKEGNVRRLIIRNGEGRTLIEIPLTIGVVAGGALAFFYPILAVLAGIGGLYARVRIEIVRENTVESAVEDAKQKVEEISDNVSE